MTELQKMYVKARIEGLRHRAALRSIARETGIDEDSIARALARAKREDARDAKKAAKEAA